MTKSSFLVFSFGAWASFSSPGPNPKQGYEGLFKKAPVIDKWTFSTNGVSIMGRYGIPCLGFGPGDEKEAHAPNEKTRKDDLVICAALYATLPLLYLENLGKK